MASMRPFAFALLGILTVAVVAPVQAQNPKPAKTKTTKSAPARPMGNMDRTPAMMSGGMMSPGAGNNTAAVQGNIDKANTTLNSMVALLDQIDARKKTP